MWICVHYPTLDRETSRKYRRAGGTGRILFEKEQAHISTGQHRETEGTEIPLPGRQSNE